jgi:hypothetical protein
MATYLSKEMIARVQTDTLQVRYNVPPDTLQYTSVTGKPKIWTNRVQIRTTIPNNKSATARLKSKELVKFTFEAFNFLENRMQTRELPFIFLGRSNR